MAAQLVQLDWPLPDLIVPVPLSLPRLWKKGGNPSEGLAEEIGEILQRPCVRAVRCSSGLMNPLGVPVEQYYLSENVRLEDKICLLVDNRFSPGEQLRACGAALADGFPHKLYVLTLVR